MEPKGQARYWNIRCWVSIQYYISVFRYYIKLNWTYYYIYILYDGYVKHPIEICFTISGYTYNIHRAGYMRHGFGWFGIVWGRAIVILFINESMVYHHIRGDTNPCCRQCNPKKIYSLCWMDMYSVETDIEAPLSHCQVGWKCRSKYGTDIVAKKLCMNATKNNRHKNSQKNTHTHSAWYTTYIFGSAL